MGGGNETTLAEVASLAGVSKTAAWAALSDRKTNIGLGDDTRRRILRVAKQMDYQRNILGSSLAKRKSFLVALLCRETFELSTLEVLRGIQDVLLDLEYSLVTYAHGDTVDDEARHIKFSLARRVDGMIVMPALDADGRTNAGRLTALQRRGFPLVQLFNRTLPGIPTVMMDHRAAGRMATEHLVELGHRRIIHFTQEDYRDEQTSGYNRIARLRWEGYREVMEHAGLEPRVATHDTVASVRKILDAAQKAAAGVLAHPARPTGVVSYCDFEALALVREAIHRGIRVPEDISITGIDDLQMLSVDFPGLTTLSPPLRMMGQAAARMVLEQSSGARVEDQVLVPELLVRASTGPANGAMKAGKEG